MLRKPLRIKIGGWQPQTVDAWLEFEGIVWLRVEGGFGDGQRTNWHPREDWVAMLPATAASVSRYFDKPHCWGKGSARITPRSMLDAMRDEVDNKLNTARYDLRDARDRVARLERTIEMLGRSAAHHRTEEAVA